MPLFHTAEDRPRFINPVRSLRRRPSPRPPSHRLHDSRKFPATNELVAVLLHPGLVGTAPTLPGASRRTKAALTAFQIAFTAGVE
jgi:hypothetical protein